ncbi:MAG: cytochrome c biogenesis protein ResB [Candidatus Riflebacteria bacterium]|nr:cytochrome c biogenesis protein ResB [Candidatus Riflebacteria bacterium]
MRTIHKLLVSLKTAVLLLTVLSCLSIIGTLIPQEREASEIRSMFPRFGNTIIFLGFDDLYHSPPFIGALGLMSLCTLFCTWTRFKFTRRRLFKRLENVSISEIRSFHVSRELRGVKDPSRFVSGWTRRDFEDGVSVFLRVHGRAALIGGLLIHVGLLIILGGGVYGSQVGVETAIRGMEGDSMPIAPLEAVKAAVESDRLRRWGRRVEVESPKDPRLEGLHKRIDELDAQYRAGIASPVFEMKVNKLWVDTPKTPDEAVMVRNWNSSVSVVEHGRTVASAVIRVNEPFSWGAYTFFQSDWAKKYHSIRVEIVPTAAEAASATSAEARVVSMPIGRPVKFDWCPYWLVVLNFYPDFKIMDQEFVSVSDEMRNPVARIEGYDKDEKPVGDAWAFSRQLADMGSHFSKKPLPYRFVVIDGETDNETGLQVASNPSVPIVWLGCILMTMGLCLAFYVTYREEWAVLKPDGKMILAVGGNRPPIMLVPALEALVETAMHVSGPDGTSVVEKEGKS